eukprot:294719-Prorocentrum_lima.AAC.1
MTSSLVGSEMCIRDSLQPDVECAMEALRTGACQGHGPSIYKATCRNMGCLLYTSDAADDM